METHWKILLGLLGTNFIIQILNQFVNISLMIY